MDASQFNSLMTRNDLQSVVRELAEPIQACRSIGGARVQVGTNAASYSMVSAEMEGFCRPLWGLGPLMAGGGYYRDWDSIRQGLINGTDPTHPEFWGLPGNFDQRLVEMAALGVTLCLVPNLLWDPLTPAEQSQVAVYLESINSCRLPQNNWYFFRVFVNLALERIGVKASQEKLTNDLERLESYYLGDGWYSDGVSEQRDYYIPCAMHYYGLLYASLAQEQDPERCVRFRQRAARFAQDFVMWFAADGSALPYGRSLTYRFAQGAFWGALAFSGVEALPWGIIKGLLLRHLRWWLRQPIFTKTGLLTLGYTYPNLNMTEQYNAPSSPYWAFKVFLPLALPETHPFWSAVEQPLPDLPHQSLQPHARMILCRDNSTDHTYALAGGQWTSWQLRHGAEKYAKFCYSNRFGFNVPTATSGLSYSAHDNMLVLSEDGNYFRARGKCKHIEVTAEAIRSTWCPWPDVIVTTWLIPAGVWHVRVHHILSMRHLFSAEGGFALSCVDSNPGSEKAWQCTRGLARAESSSGFSLIRDLLKKRKGQIVRAAPNSNLLHPQVVIPTLKAKHVSNRFWLACAVQGIPRIQPGAIIEGDAPKCKLINAGFAVIHHDKILYAWSGDSLFKKLKRNILAVFD